MIYCVIECATGRVVGESATGWAAAIYDAHVLKNITFEVYDALRNVWREHADGFALHGYTLGTVASPTEAR